MILCARGWFTRLNSSYTFPEAVVIDSAKVFAEGKTQYEEFRRTRFTLGIHNNNNYVFIFAGPRGPL